MIYTTKHKLVLRSILAIYLAAAADSQPDEHVQLVEEMKQGLDDDLEGFTDDDIHDLFDVVPAPESDNDTV